MGVMTIQEKYENWIFDDLVKEGFASEEEYHLARKWSKRGWDRAIEEIQKEGLKEELERHMRELERMAKNFPTEFQEVVEKLEKELT